MAQRFNFLFVRDFLALNHFNQSQHFFHLLQCLFQRFNYLSDLIDGFADGVGGRFGGLSFFFSNAGRTICPVATALAV